MSPQVIGARLGVVFPCLPSYSPRRAPYSDGNDTSVFITRNFFESQSCKMWRNVRVCEVRAVHCNDLCKASEQHSARSYFRNLSFLACSTLMPSMNNLARGRSFGAFSLDVAIYPDANDAKRGSPSRGRGK